jgi:branched-chain amino acid transport system permease protein
METFVTLTMNGLANGAILAMASLGFVVVFKATGIINFAQGEFLLIGAYLIHQFRTVWGWHWSVAIVAAVIVAALMGIVIERLILRPLIGESTISVIMVTIGLSLALLALTLWVWGASPFPPPDFISKNTVEMLGANVPINRFVAVGVAVAVFTGFSIFFRRTKQGLAMRAVADDQQAAMAQGINVHRVFAFSWALAAASAVLGGMILSQVNNAVQLELSATGIAVFPVVILGGLESIAGTAVGGVLIGLFNSYTGGYLNGRIQGFDGLQEVVPFVLLVLILLIKPHGLFGQAQIERV